MTETPNPYGSRSRGVSPRDVERAADALLHLGERPTIDKVRQKLGTGSPNTINPLLDVWWKKLSTRLDAGPAAFHRLPESVAHVAETLWMQALDEGRRRAQLEFKSKERTALDQQQTLEVRSHILSLREGELDSRLHDRDNTITGLNQQLRELTLLLRKEQATRDAQARRIAVLEAELHPLQRPQPTLRRPRAQTKLKPALGTRGAAEHARSSTKKLRKKQTPTSARLRTNHNIRKRKRRSA
jgi:hypothetical protein